VAKLINKKASATKRVVVYGASFSGKSLLVGKLAEHFKLLWVDLEAGHGVLYQLPASFQENIEIVSLPDTRSYPIAIETMLKLVKGPVDICELHGKVSCMVCKRNDAETVHVDVNSMQPDTILVVDTLTQLSNSAISNITKGEPDDYKLSFDDYGNLGKLLDIVLSHIQQASYNVVVISHENEVVTEGKKTTLSPTGGTRNFSRNITKYFTDVVYLERKNKKHTCISTTTSSTSVIAGSQSGVALETLGEPSLLPLFRPDLAPMPAVPAKTLGLGKKLAGNPQATVAGQTSSILANIKAKQAAAKK
tara:strand:- start:2253 stop:3170 length:918 start_codon:yes stop_codon:yes gene_type:complete